MKQTKERFKNPDSKKKKITAKETANLLVGTLDVVIANGFVEIQDFINNNNNLEDNPNLTDEDVEWFRNIIFLGNMKNLDTFFEEKESIILRGFILEIVSISSDSGTVAPHTA